MAKQDKRVDIYEKCKHIMRSKFNNLKEDESSLRTTFDLLPLFEKDQFEKGFVTHYSMERNELLKCRWSEYVKNIEYRVFAPFQFPSRKDLHFHNGAVKFIPSETLTDKNHRRSLRPGPGVDFCGQMPIPQDTLMKRGTSKPVIAKTAKTRPLAKKHKVLPKRR